MAAKIEDEVFWQQVHQSKIKFGEGDRLRVLLHWKVVKTRSNKLVPKNTIPKVYEVMERPVQMRLEGINEDQSSKPKRKIREQ